MFYYECHGYGVKNQELQAVSGNGSIQLPDTVQIINNKACGSLRCTQLKGRSIEPGEGHCPAPLPTIHRGDLRKTLPDENKAWAG